MRNPLKRGVRYWRSQHLKRWHEVIYHRGTPRVNERCGKDAATRSGNYVEAESLPAGAVLCKHCFPGGRFP